MSYKNIPIVSVTPTEHNLVVAWHLHDRCNFDCMYCPDKWHSLTSGTKSLDELKRCWVEIVDKTKHRGLKYKISLTGGEVTVNQDLMPFVAWLNSEYKDQIESIGMVTNGTASRRLYIDLLKYLNWISFSIHSEFFNEKKFFINVLAARLSTVESDKTVHVNIMDEPWNHDRIKIYKNFLTEYNINYSVSEIDWSLKIRDVAKTNPNKNFFNFDDYTDN